MAEGQMKPSTAVGETGRSEEHASSGLEAAKSIINSDGNTNTVAESSRNVKSGGAAAIAEILGGHRSGDGWLCHCPAHDDRTPSLSVTEHDGKILVNCHAGCSQTDVIDAIRRLGAWPQNGSSVHRPKSSRQRRKKRAAVIPIPEERKDEINRLATSEWSRKNRGTAVRAWRYHTPGGDWAFGVVRFERDGSKNYIPYYLDAGDNRIREGQPFEDNRPLYRLPEIIDNNGELPVLVCEGEKAADAAQAILGDVCLVTTWCGGSKAVKRTDWTPLQDAVVTIWPDRDEPGRYASSVICRLLPQARVIDAGSGEDGWDAADALAEGWDSEKTLTLIGSATKPEDEAADNRPEIEVTAGDTPEIAERVLSIVNPMGEIYQFGEERAVPVRIANGATEVVGLSWLMGFFERNVRFTRFDARSKSLVARDCPDRLAKHVLDSRGSWPFPAIRGIVHTPVVRLDGSILSTPGYDEKTRLLYLPAAAAKNVPMEPSKDDVRAALKTLWRPFHLFPYDSDRSRTVALSAMLTSPERPLFDKAPANVFDAPSAGTGKTIQAQSIAAIGTGKIIAPTAWPDSEEEVRKSLFSAFLSSPPAHLIDNVEGPIRSPSLNMAITSERMSGRILGRSETADVPTRTLIMISGNNVLLVGDLFRRGLTCRLDAGIEKPFTREFDFNPLEMAVSQWQALAAAVMTILRGYFVAGAPKAGRGTIGSFESWDRLIRQAILWIRDNELAPFNPVDLIDVIETAFHRDPETTKLSNLLSAWHVCYGSKSVTVRQAIQDATATDAGGDFVWPDLNAAVDDIAGYRGRLNAHTLGRFIGRYRDRVVDGLHFAADTLTHGTARWTVMEADNASPF